MSRRLLQSEQGRNIAKFEEAVQQDEDPKTIELFKVTNQKRKERKGRLEQVDSKAVTKAPAVWEL
jgi:hypothetical protein